MERIPIPPNAALFDKAVADLQTLFAGELTWLDHAFGICERVTRTIDNKRYNIASVYTGADNYEQIEPCVKLGNFCFFYLRDPQEFGRMDKDQVHTPLSIIFWYDMRKVGYPTSRNREAIKAKILSLVQGAHLPNGTIVGSRIYEEPKNVFADFSYDYVDNQFLMSPFAGLRIDAVLYADIPCYTIESNDK